MLALSLGEHYSYSVQESQGRVQGGVCVNDPPLPEFRAQCSTKRIKGGE